MLNVNPEVNCV